MSATQTLFFQPGTHRKLRTERRRPIQILWWCGGMVVHDICSENMGIRDPIMKNIKLGRR